MTTQQSDRSNGPWAAVRRLVLAFTGVALGYLFAYHLPNCARNSENAVASPSPVASSSQRDANRNVVVILIDTLRADHLPFHGYAQNTAPFLASVAAKGVLFERAFSGSSWTAPATASVFTSQLPSQHGVITGFAATKGHQREDPHIELNRIPKELETLGEFAARVGYTTIGVADNVNIGGEIGFNRGFSKFTKFNNEGAEVVNAKAREYLAALPQGRPYFLYLHYMDTHAPYESHDPWYNKCLNAEDKGQLDKLQCAYDSEIRYLDGQIEKLFAEYDWLSSSIVIVLSDHGEEFKDHGQHGHGKSLYTELIHVPFFFHYPGNIAQTVKRNVHTMDMLPTLAALIDTPALPQWKGRNLVPLMHGDAPTEERPIFSERLRHANSEQTWSKRSVIVDDWHFIRTDSASADSTTELYNLSHDFREKQNKTKELAEKTQHLATLLEKSSHSGDLPAQAGETMTIEADQKMLDQLKTLGYFE